MNKVVPIFDDDKMRQQLVDNKEMRLARVFAGTKEQNLENQEVRVFNSVRARVTVPRWAGSGQRESFMAETHALRHRVQNEANPSSDTIAQLMGRYFIDLQRQADDLADYLPILSNVYNDPNMPKQVDLRDFLPYTGKEKQMSGTNDSVPLIEEFLGNTTPVQLKIMAFGHKTTLYQMVFNPVYSIDKVLKAAAAIRADSRNAEIIKPIVQATYPASHTQEFIQEAGATADINRYITLRAALRKVLGLYSAVYPQKKMASMHPEVYILCNSVDAMDIQALVSGALAQLAIQFLVTPLAVRAIIPYDGGIQDGLQWGSETLSFPGVPEGVCYFVLKSPFTAAYLQKRDTTLETGTGDVLQLSSEERSWYRIGASFNDWLLPGEAGSKPTGAVLKCKLNP